MPPEELKPTETMKVIVKHEPISVSISSKLHDKPVFLGDRDLGDYNTSLLNFLQTRICWLKRIKLKCNPTIWKMKKHQKAQTRLHTIFSILMKDAVSIKVKQDKPKTNVSRMRKKQTYPLTSQDSEKSFDWFIATSRVIHHYSTSIWIQQWSVW